MTETLPHCDTCSCQDVGESGPFEKIKLPKPAAKMVQTCLVNNAYSDIAPAIKVGYQALWDYFMEHEDEQPIDHLVLKKVIVETGLAERTANNMLADLRRHDHVKYEKIKGNAFRFEYWLIDVPF